VQKFFARVELRGLLILAALLTAGTFLAALLPQGPFFRGVDIIDKHYTWDATYYQVIALSGYGVDTAGVPPQRFAFFPGWPIIQHFLREFCSDVRLGRIVSVLFCAAAGVLSIFSFGRLARLALPKESAAFAIILYCCDPGATFFLQAYPTALMQLGVILVLENLLLDKIWRAAAIGGLATCLCPSMVFVSAVVVVWGAYRQLRQQGPRAALMRLPVLGALSISGLLAFMTWLTWRYGEPLVFVRAGHAWEPALSLGQKILRATALLSIVVEPIMALLRFYAALRQAMLGHWPEAQRALQSALNLLVIFTMSIGTLAALRIRQKLPALQAGFFLAGFICFNAVPQGAQAAPRLLFPAIGAFLGLAVLAPRHRKLMWAVCLGFALVLVMDQAFSMAGYWVV
jgi:hypothetical protein